MGGGLCCQEARRLRVVLLSIQDENVQLSMRNTELMEKNRLLQRRLDRARDRIYDLEKRAVKVEKVRLRSREEGGDGGLRVGEEGGGEGGGEEADMPTIPNHSNLS